MKNCDFNFSLLRFIFKRLQLYKVNFLSFPKSLKLGVSPELKEHAKNILSVTVEKIKTWKSYYYNYLNIKVK